MAKARPFRPNHTTCLYHASTTNLPGPNINSGRRLRRPQPNATPQNFSLLLNRPLGVNSPCPPVQSLPYDPCPIHLHHHDLFRIPHLQDRSLHQHQRPGHGVG